MPTDFLFFVFDPQTYRSPQATDHRDARRRSEISGCGVVPYHVPAYRYRAPSAVNYAEYLVPCGVVIPARFAGIMQVLVYHVARYHYSIVSHVRSIMSFSFLFVLRASTGYGTMILISFSSLC